MSTAQAAAAEYLIILSAEQISKFCALGAYTWFLYDYVITLPTEIQYVWLKPWGFSKALYLWMRYFGVALLTVCFHYYVWEGCGGSIMLFTVEVVLQLRIYAMYNKNKILAAVNFVFFAMEIITMLTVYNIGIRVGTTLATPPGITGCWGTTTSYLFSIWFPGLAFECWLAGLAVWKAIDRARRGVMINGKKVDLLALLIRDSVVYFFLIAAGLASNAFIWLASTSAVDTAVVPLAHASMIVGGSRLFLNLREAYYADRDATATWQFSTMVEHRPFERFSSHVKSYPPQIMAEFTGTFSIPDIGLTYRDVELEEVNADTA